MKRVSQFTSKQKYKFKDENQVPKYEKKVMDLLEKTTPNEAELQPGSSRPKINKSVTVSLDQGLQNGTHDMVADTVKTDPEALPNTYHSSQEENTNDTNIVNPSPDIFGISRLINKVTAPGVDMFKVYGSYMQKLQSLISTINMKYWTADIFI